MRSRAGESGRYSGEKYKLFITHIPARGAGPPDPSIPDAPVFFGKLDGSFARSCAGQSPAGPVCGDVLGWVDYPTEAVQAMIVRATWRVILCIFLSAALASLIGCGPKTTTLHTSSTFTPESVEAWGLGIGGVVSVVAEDRAQLTSSEELGELLRLSIMEERTDLKVQPAGALSAALGSNRHREILSAYHAKGALTREVFAGVDSLLQRSVRYLVFARVEGDVINHTASGTEDSGMNKASERKVTVSFQVWDLPGADSAWEGRIAGSESNQVSYSAAEEEEEEDGGGIWGAIADWIVSALFGGGDDEDEASRQPFPEPPTFEQAIEPVFHEFAKKLPKEE